MTNRRDSDDILEAWLDETNSARLPETTHRAIDVTVRSTAQHQRAPSPFGWLTPYRMTTDHERVALGPWRHHAMSNFSRLALAATVVAVGAFAWMNLGQPRGGIGALPTTTTPTAAPSPTAAPEPPPTMPLGLLEPGRYALPVASDFASPAEPEMSVEVPAGWTGSPPWLDKNYGLSREQSGGTVARWVVEGTFVDPCHDHTLVTPQPTGIDDLAQALANQPGTTGTVSDVVVDGYVGKQVDVIVTTDISTCGGFDGFWVFAAAGGDRRYSQVTGETNRIYILDVDGERVTYFARFTEMMTPADRSELEAILDSVEITP